MAIRFTYRGQEYRADTPEEALKLETLLRETAEKRAKADPAFARKLAKEEGGWTDEKFRDAVDRLGPLQVKMLVLILDEETVFANELAKHLGLPSQVALAGVLSGLSKQIKPLGLRPTDILHIDVHWKGRDKERSFRLRDGFQAIAEDNDFGLFVNEADRNRKKK